MYISMFELWIAFAMIFVNLNVTILLYIGSSMRIHLLKTITLIAWRIWYKEMHLWPLKIVIKLSEWRNSSVMNELAKLDDQIGEADVIRPHISHWPRFRSFQWRKSKSVKAVSNLNISLLYLVSANWLLHEWTKNCSRKICSWIIQ